MVGNRERRAAKQAARDRRRGRTDPGASPRDGVGRGLAPETLRAVLRSTATDLAAGDEHALAELRLLLTEHLARRRPEILAACDDVVADPTPAGDATDPASDLASDLAAALAAGRSVTDWAQGAGVGTEAAVVATVRVLAARA